MACCGEKRAELVSTPKISHAVPQRGEAVSDHQPEQDTLTYFQYVGKTRLTVIGRETRRLYRFDRPGAVAWVDKRDQRSMEKVPSLRLVRVTTS
jgi:hypothetical protein